MRATPYLFRWVDTDTKEDLDQDLMKRVVLFCIVFLFFFNRTKNEKYLKEASTTVRQRYNEKFPIKQLKK